jgi:DNA-directed DNA polymerase III PolC
VKFQENFERYGNFGLNGVLLPQFKIDNKYYHKLGIAEDVDNFTFLKSLCELKLSELGKDKDQKYIDRLEYELKTLHELGFVDYILLIWDIVNWAKENKIAVGPARGSAGGSLTCYLSGITSIDAVKYDLIFERFVSAARAQFNEVDGIKYLDGGSLPDVDLDFSYYHRQDIINHIEDKFEGRTCKVLTCTTLASKVALKEAAKTAAEYNETEVTSLASNIGAVFGKVTDLAEAIEESKEIKRWVNEPRKKYKYVDNKRVFNIAQKIEKLPKNFGVHPSAMAVTYDKLEKTFPTQMTKDGHLVTAYDMYTVQEYAVKVDALGLKTMSVLDEICNKVGVDMEEIPLDDPTIFQQFNSMDLPYGIFQIEAPTQYSAAKKVKPDNLQEVSDLMALARPGALSYIDTYVENKGKDKIEAGLHPKLDEILASTKNVALFQEQMMSIGHDVFGLSLRDTNNLRKIVGKKLVKEIPKWKDRIYKAAEERGLQKELADAYWKILDDSKNYSFNRSHSTSYAKIAVWCMYLKFNYPREFYLAWLRMAKHEPNPHEQINKIVNELKSFNIELLPPDLAKSEMEFSAEGDNAIRFGLSAIKGISDKSIEALSEFRKTQGETLNKFELFEAAKQAKLNIGILSALIQAGALNSLNFKNKNRAYSVLEAQTFNLLTDRLKKYVIALGEEFNYDIFDLLRTIVAEERKMENGKTPILRQSQYDNIKKKAEGYIEIFKRNSKYNDLANWFFEYKLLGYNYTSDLYTVLKKEMPKVLEPISEFEKLGDRDHITTCGVIMGDPHNKKSKAGKEMFKFTLSDAGTAFCILFDNNYIRWSQNNTDEKGKIKWPKDGDLVVVKGSRFNDALFLNNIFPLEEKAYFKLSDLKS